MYSTRLAVLLSLVFWAGPDPSELLNRLGSPRFSERQEAMRSLEALGQAALPVLRKAQRTNDPEVRNRAFALVERIEKNLMLSPTMVRLNFREQLLEDVVEALTDRSGIPIRLDPNTADLREGRRITIVAEEPVSFWEAIDRLGRTARQSSEMMAVPSPGGHPIGFGVFLTEAGSRMTPISSHGPFRLRIVGFHLQRDLELGPPPGDPTGGFTEQFEVHLRLEGEPRLIFGQAGSPSLNEAIDDQGQSLLIRDARGATVSGSVTIVEFNGGASLLLHAGLRYPQRRGATLRRLRGVVPVIVASRKPKPLEISLKGSAGKSFLGSDLILTNHSGPNFLDHGPLITLRLGLRSINGQPIPLTPALLDAQFEVVDARDQPIPAYTRPIDLQGLEVSLNLVIALPDTETVPDRLRFHGLTRAEMEIPFAFEGVPLP